MKLGLILLIVIGISAALVWTGRGGREGEIAPARVLREKYGLTAENRPEIHLNPDHVPPDLRHLVPLAERWGVGDDIIRGDLVERASQADRRELHDALDEPYQEITAWLRSFGDRPMSEEAAAFMYMQEAADEMGIFILEEKEGASGSG